MSFLSELKRRNVLRVAVAYLVLAWLLVQVASILLPTFHAPDWVMQVLVLVLAAGFIATLVFSWVYELTPDGLRRDSQVDPSQSIAHHTARKLDLAVIALLIVVGVVTVLAQRRAPAPAPATVASSAAVDPAVAAIPPANADATAAVTDPGPSVAVLPFVNMSSVAENEYFADGLSETLLNMLAQVSGLKVAARTSAFAFKGSKTDIREIARTLNVRTVLEGSVQRAGERVRITAQLIDARDGNHLWSRSYDRTLEDIFAIQDEIAKEVAAELTRSLLGTVEAGARPDGSPATRSPAAYDLYLRGLSQFNLNTYESLPQAERVLEQALEIDPGFDDARILLARSYFAMAETGLLARPEAAQRGHAVLEPLLQGEHPDPIALSLDAMLRWQAADAVAQRASLAHAQETLMGALTQAPNNAMLHFLAALTMRQDPAKATQALQILDRGLAIDPLSVGLLNSRARQLASMGRYDEALESLARFRKLAPRNPTGYYRAGQVYSARGPYVEAVKWYAQAAGIDGRDHELSASVAQHLMAMGMLAEALPWIRRAELLNATGSDTRRVAMHHAAEAGERERALTLAAAVIRERRDNRRNVYGTALCIYFSLMHEAGTLDDAMAFVGPFSPALLASPPVPAANEFDFLVVWTAGQFLAGGWDTARRSAYSAALSEGVKSLDPRNYEFGAGGIDVVIAALAGEDERAAVLLEQLLASPARLPWHWRIFLRSPVLARAVADPRIAAARAKLEADFAQQAIRYRELVASGEIVVP